MNTTRRRYDTTSLVQALKSERHKSLIAGLIGIALLAGVVLYVFSGINSGDSHESANVSYGGDLTGGAARVDVAPSPPVPAPPPTDFSNSNGPSKLPTTDLSPSKVDIVVGKKMPIWIDNRWAALAPEHSLTLSPGDHQIKVKAGKKFIIAQLSVKAGENYAVRFDLKKRKATTEVVR